MPNKINLPYPPGLGAEDRELQSYLYKLVEQLNVCLESVDVEQISGAMKGTLERITGLGKDIDRLGSSTSEALVNAIQKVKNESDLMDREIRVALRTLQEDLRNEIKGSAVVLEHDYLKRFNDIAESAEKFSKSITKDVNEVKEMINAYIDDNGTAMEALTARVTALESRVRSV